MVIIKCYTLEDFIQLEGNYISRLESTLTWSITDVGCFPMCY
ncbi:uncharacterized protein J3R85_002084 [Psidium guajava]|nr:uncharacterized protein J3R85_002084 [Psidium guajava]